MTDKSALPPRAVLEAAAKQHGVTVSPSMTHRAIAEAVAAKIQPGTYTFPGKGDGYVAKAFEIATAEPAKPAAPPPAPAPAPAPAAPPEPTVASPSVPAQGAPLNGSGMAAAARNKMIQNSLKGVGA